MPPGDRVWWRTPRSDARRTAPATSGKLPQFRIVGVAERLSEKGESEGGKDDRQASRNGQPRRFAHKGVTVIENRSPGWRRRTYAEAKKAHAGLGRDHHRHIHA